MEQNAAKINEVGYRGNRNIFDRDQVQDAVKRFYTNNDVNNTVAFIYVTQESISGLHVAGSTSLDGLIGWHTFFGNINGDNRSYRCGIYDEMGVLREFYISASATPVSWFGLLHSVEFVDETELTGTYAFAGWRTNQEGDFTQPVPVVEIALQFKNMIAASLPAPFDFDGANDLTAISGCTIASGAMLNAVAGVNFTFSFKTPAISDGDGGFLAFDEAFAAKLSKWFTGVSTLGIDAVALEGTDWRITCTANADTNDEFWFAQDSPFGFERSGDSDGLSDLLSFNTIDGVGLSVQSTIGVTSPVAPSTTNWGGFPSLALNRMVDFGRIVVTPSATTDNGALRVGASVRGNFVLNVSTDGGPYDMTFADGFGQYCKIVLGENPV